MTDQTQDTPMLPNLPVPTAAPQPMATASPQPGIAALSAPSDTEENLPMPPSGGASMLQQLQAKGSPFLQNLAKHTNAAAAANPQVANQPGGWARTLLSGAMGAMSGLGDAAAVGTVPSGGGALEGIARTVAARGQRIQQQKEDISKEKNAELLRAETTQRIAAATRNMYRQDQQDRLAEYNSNATFMSNLRKKYNTSNDQDNVTQDQLNQMVKDPNFWKTHTGRATGEEPVMSGGKQVVDKNGNPVFSPLYSISNVQGAPERTHPVSEEEAKYIKSNAGDNITPGTELNLQQYDNIMVRADSARQAKQKIEKANDEDLSEEQARQLNTVLQNPRIQRYMATNPEEPLAGLYTAQKNVQSHISAIDQMIAAVENKAPSQPGQPNPTTQALQQKKQEFIEEGQNVDKAISGFNEQAKNDYIKRQDEQAKQAEVARHNRADEQIRAAEAAAKKGDFAGNPDAATPEAFLASLPPTARSTVQLIGTGRAPLHNPSYLLARKPEIMEAVAKAYPDFDISKVDSYQQAYKNFTSGKTSVELKSGATALGHLYELQQLNTAASHIPHTSAWTAYQNKADTLATELAKFYGDATVPGIAAIKETLTSTLLGNREAAITTQAQSMSDKFNNLEQEWKNAAPSKVYEAEMPGMSLQAKIARAKLDPVYASQHPELGVKSSGQGAAQGPVAPQGATQTYKDAQGNVRGWAVNGKFVPVGQQ